jgi:ATP phosphoribosyltransferase regulatory subunit
MQDKKIHTPDGVKDFLPSELALKINVERKIEAIFNRYGYQMIASPMFEFMEVFEGKGSVSEPQIYKFMDRDGATLALRSDMTPAIARIAATAYSKEDLPLRFCYFANTFRNNESYQGKLKEATQVGVELIGADTDEATAEVIAVAARSLLAVGLTNFRLDIGSVEFFKAIIKDTAFNAADYEVFQQYILDKDFVSAEDMIRKSDSGDDVKNLFSELPFLIGGQAVLEKARATTKNTDALAALNQLENIYEILREYGLEDYISFDLSMIGYLDYYTGIIFRGYAHGAPTAIIDGGRYDTLLSKFGADYPAVGFAIKADMLLSAMKGMIEESPSVKPDALISYTKEGRKMALITADELRRTGMHIENCLNSGALDDQIGYAKKRGFGGVLHFMDDENVQIINLVNDSVKTAKISELLGE